KNSLEVADADDLVQLAATSADELMDTVFEDVDYMLDKGVSLVPTSSRESTPGLTHAGTAQSTATALGLPASSFTNAMSSANVPPSSGNSLGATVASDSSLPSTSAQKGGERQSNEASQQQWQQAFNIAFPILGACATLGIALAVGFILYGPSSSVRVAGVNEATVGASGSSPHGDFADYMERALDAIAVTEQTDRLASEEAEPTSDFPSSPSTTSSRSSDVPERVYIPVYQPPQPSLTPLPTIPIEGGISTPSPSPISSGTAAQPNIGSAASPTTTSGSVAPSSTSTSDSSPSPVLSDLSHDHILVGLLQLGDRSVAMFDFSDGTHRVSVGEQIGSSGWSLVSVSQNEAVIRRNGDVRSIYIGQSF
ncbi:MAG: hypothetical protein F6K09_31935, partial [Merismopedia sp. SIO2A8]|nr:hypothetical protein [Merismopedia sp. SIO2A8]